MLCSDVLVASGRAGRAHPKFAKRNRLPQRSQIRSLGVLWVSGFFAGVPQFCGSGLPPVSFGLATVSSRGFWGTRWGESCRGVRTCGGEGEAFLLLGCEVGLRFEG